MSGPRRRGPVARALLAVLRFYQRAISPAFPPRCRFYPTCSSYALEAVERHGAARGSWLALRRLLKCAPWHPGGVDLVPEPRHRQPADADGAGTRGTGPSSSVRAAGAPAAPRPTGDGPARRTRTVSPPAASGTAQQEAGVA